MARTRKQRGGSDRTSVMELVKANSTSTSQYAAVLAKVTGAVNSVRQDINKSTDQGKTALSLTLLKASGGFFGSTKCTDRFNKKLYLLLRLVGANKDKNVTSSAEKCKLTNEVNAAEVTLRTIVQMIKDLQILSAGTDDAAVNRINATFTSLDADAKDVLRDLRKGNVINVEQKLDLDSMIQRPITLGINLDFAKIYENSASAPFINNLSLIFPDLSTNAALAVASAASSEEAQALAGNFGAALRSPAPVSYSNPMMSKPGFVVDPNSPKARFDEFDRLARKYGVSKNARILPPEVLAAKEAYEASKVKRRGGSRRTRKYRKSRKARKTRRN